MGFDTAVTLTGPFRSPAQMLADQVVDDHASVHDDRTASSLGLDGAPIEGPTHFSQFDPLAVLVWGSAWFERGCISSHFRTMVTEGEQVQASLTIGVNDVAAIEARKADGSQVLSGTASIGPNHGPTELDRRRADQGAPGELFIVDQLEVGMRLSDGLVSMSFDDRNGPAYPFSLAEKLDRITEAHPWYTTEGAKSSPWGLPIVPMEMISVLANKSGNAWPIRTPASDCSSTSRSACSMDRCSLITSTKSSERSSVSARAGERSPTGRGQPLSTSRHGRPQPRSCCTPACSRSPTRAIPSIVGPDRQGRASCCR